MTLPDAATSTVEPPPAAPRPAGPPAGAADLVLRVLSNGPLTAFEVADLAEAAEPGLFSMRHGFVLPLLLELRRDGRAVAEWHDAPGGRRCVHRAAEAAGTPLGRELPHVGSSAAPAGAAAAIDLATRPLAFAPRLREEFVRELRQLVADGRADAFADGVSPADADARAVRALGDPWKIGVDLARTAQGRRTVVFSRGLGDTFAGLAIYDLRVLAVILCVILFVRVQIVTAYHIPTKSMEPTLHGDARRGDRILVNKLAGAPKRFDITVFDGFRQDRKNFVKRCTGLPGEKLSLFEGDLYVDGTLVRKDGDPYEALLFEVFDRAREHDRAEGAGAAEREASFRKTMQELWPFGGDGECGVQEDASAPFAGFRLAAKRDALPDARPPELTWHRMVEDSYVDSDTGEPRGGTNNVADMRITFRVKPVPGTGAEVAAVLTRGDENVYTASLVGRGKGVALFADGVEVARDESVTLPEGVPTEVGFSHVDRVLRLTVNGRLVLRHDVPQPAFPKRYGPPGSPFLRVTAGAAWIDPVRLERDVYYVPEVAPENLERLGPDQFFMMGDNSANSSDSRTHGPVHRSRLIGAPLLVVWPPSRMHVPR